MEKQLIIYILQRSNSISGIWIIGEKPKRKIMSKLTTCEDCNKEVSTSANSCPHCGKEQDEGFDIISTLLAVGMVVLFIGFAIGYVEDNRILVIRLLDSITG